MRQEGSLLAVWETERKPELATRRFSKREMVVASITCRQREERKKKKKKKKKERRRVTRSSFESSTQKPVDFGGIGRIF